MTEHHKQIAQQLRAVLAEQGIIIQHAHALHIIAAAYGLPNWNTLAARPQTPALEPQQAMAAIYERLSDYSDKKPNLSVKFGKDRLNAITCPDPNEPRMGSQAWFEKMDREGIPVFAPVFPEAITEDPNGHFLNIEVVPRKLAEGRSGPSTPAAPQQLFKRVTGPEAEPSSEMLTAELLALLKKEAVEATEKEAQEWAPKLKGLTQDTHEVMLKIRRMVYDTYMADKAAAKAQGKKHKGRYEHQNEMLLRALCKFAGVRYQPPYDPVKEALFDEIMSDPFLQSEWFEELDIMN